MSIALPSLQSLHLTLYANSNQIGNATGFVVLREGDPYLVTNWHVVSGRNPATGQPTNKRGAVPDEVEILYLSEHTPKKLTWQSVREKLLDNSGAPLWLEDLAHGRQVDVAALPLRHTMGKRLYPYELESPSMSVGQNVADMVRIVGFPFGLYAAGAMAIWSTGAIATEPSLDFDDLPCFLIDSRTRRGQSGSPVIFYSSGGAINLDDGSTVFTTGPTTLLLGVYSGRLIDSAIADGKDTPENSTDLGIVWRKSVIGDILRSGVQGNTALPRS